MIPIHSGSVETTRPEFLCDLEIGKDAINVCSGPIPQPTSGELHIFAELGCLANAKDVEGERHNGCNVSPSKMPFPTKSNKNTAQRSEGSNKDDCSQNNQGLQPTEISTSSAPISRSLSEVFA
jgi:hypothetical protein